MKYTSGSVKKGRRTYYYIKNTETGLIEPQCTKYLKWASHLENSILQLTK